MKQTVIRIGFLLSLSATFISAQFLALKTVPVVTGGQFLIFPSQNAGMGFVSIAVDDPLGNPFQNPAIKSQIKKSFIYTTPVISKPGFDEGQTSTIPLGYRYIGENWHGTFSTAIQSIEDFGVTNSWQNNSVSNTSLNDHNNLFAFASMGKSIRPSDYVGLSVLWAGLDGMQGVNLLYPRSTGVDQSGYLKEIRLGTIKTLKSGESLETVFLIHEVSMEHKVTYNDWIWGRPSGFRVEDNKDQTITKGFHFKYKKPFQKNNAVGLIFTYNRKEHPKIPNYDIMNIPRDPGETDIVNIGFGFSRNIKDATFGLDFIYEPARSHTWAEAAENIFLRNDKTLFKGSKTIDNKFKFGNYRLNLGFREKTSKNSEASFGVSLYNVNYTLEQFDFILNSERTQNESWVEKKFTWGAIKHYKKFNLHYNGSLTLGTGAPGTINFNSPNTGALLSDGYTDFMVAPRGDLTLNEIFLMTHQLTITMPIR
ncbi:MAG: hypothetical protein ISR89_08680 [Candidatus Marinimicrobia bacterium]|nr:hypothetical protein [Candidatus Neomarinimicrobiota bacterium]MBL7031227.1 hypothetical protein [Candidatus Neomarinimicrobiota bacterium]